jgi:hypothetical protein
VIYPLLALLFFLSLILGLLLVLGFIFKPQVWRRYFTKIWVFAITWYLPYFIFIIFFTGPIDITQYPPQEQAKYKLPFKAGHSCFVTQGNRSFTSHRALHLYAWDFAIPLGGEILAAREGKVIKVQQSFSGVGLHDNFIWIQHEDGEISNYGHFKQNSAFVKEGDSIKQGQVIALNGMVGQTTLPHIHFVVYNQDVTESIPISFQEIPGGVPFAGHFYTSENMSK